MMEAAIIVLIFLLIMQINVALRRSLKITHLQNELAATDERYANVKNELTKTRFTLQECESEHEKLSKDQQAYIDALDKRALDIKKYYEAYSQVQLDIAVPYWIKGLDGKIIFVSNSYERLFLIPMDKTRSDYIDQPDEVIWGSEIAAMFTQNDDAAHDDPNSIILEIAHSGKPIDDKRAKLFEGWKFYKYPAYSNGELLGIGGFGIPEPGNPILKIIDHTKS